MLVKLTMIDEEIKKAIQCYIASTYGLEISVSDISFEADTSKAAFGWQGVKAVRINEIALRAQASE